jgi:hypothetical protein
MPPESLGYLGTETPDSLAANATCEAWRSLIEDRKAPHYWAEAGMQLNLGEELRLEVLHPQAS